MNALGARQSAVAALQAFATADEPLAPYTTYRVGGAAAVFASPRNDDELRMIADVVQATGLPTLVIGRGSNLLVADEGFPGIAISLASMAEWIEFHGAVVHVGASVALPVVARRSVAEGLAGFEWAVGVPGSIGGAVRMNAGGHGSDMAACLVGVHALDLRTGHHGWVHAEGLGLHFRGSQLADHQVVVDAQLQLSPGEVGVGEAALAEIVKWRREHQPGGQNAGSVFVNPIPGELPAAALVDRLGLRGFRIGGAFVSDKHANFIQASPGATASDVRAVMEHVRATVLTHTGFLLRSEVRLVGFDDVPEASDEGVAM
jgi:UDP-N-acetylmuramate dehydrogenase